MAIQEIALDIDLSVGVFKDTIYQDQRLKLRELGHDADGNSIYPATGSWESTVIRIQDKIASFKGVAAKVDVAGAQNTRSTGVHLKTALSGWSMRKSQLIALCPNRLQSMRR